MRYERIICKFRICTCTSQTILPKIFDACKINRFEVFGEINDDLIKALAQMGGMNYHFLTGFSRCQHIDET